MTWLRLYGRYVEKILCIVSDQCVVGTYSFVIVEMRRGFVISDPSEVADLCLQIRLLEAELNVALVVRTSCLFLQLV